MDDDQIRRLANSLCEWEQDVLLGLFLRDPKPWGAAVGAAYEALQSRKCITETFEVTPLGEYVAEEILRR